ncbi:MAG: hypothetical protein ACM3NR_00235 [Methanosarcina sp.]
MKGESCNSYYQLSDTLKEKQLVFNGKIWIDEYSKVDGDQFLISNVFLNGSVSMNKITFDRILLRYDIYKDELSTINDKGLILQLNKEMVDSFSLIINESNLKFIKADSLKGISGYVNVLYPGKTSLYIKYRKNIDLLAVDQKIDRFYQVQKNFLLINGIAQPFSGKLEFFRLLDDRKHELKQFIKKNNISVSRKNAESFIPVLRYYDSLIQ